MAQSPVTIQGQVYQTLKENILNDVYKPGQRLQELDLAASLNVSRSPIREALRKLAADGLVEEFPNRGVVVKKFTEEDITQIFEVRVLLESYAIHQSKAHLKPSDAVELQACLHQMRLAHQRNCLSDYIEQDTLLHQCIIRMSNNQVLVDMYQRVSAFVQRFRIYSLTSSTRFDDSFIEHTQIVTALLEGDTELADHINQRHLSLARQTILTYLACQNDD